MTDELTQALLNFEGKLESFRSAQHAHASAHRRFVEQEETTKQLFDATREAITAAEFVTSQIQSLAEELVPLAKAIRDVNFPSRLAEMHVAVTRHASKTADLQSDMERRLSDLRTEIERAHQKLANDLDKVSKSIARGGKNESTIRVLCLINTAMLVGLGTLLIAPPARVLIIAAADAVFRFVDSITALIKMWL
jgi:hypothetical protein